MTRRRFTAQPVSDDIFGPWVPIVALTASKTAGIDWKRMDVLIERVERAYNDLATAPDPLVASWRDLADAMNFLQSLMELGWGDDTGGVVNDVKAALFEAAQNMGKHGKLRLSGPNLTNLRACVDQFTELTQQLSAHSYWVAVAHAKRRVQKILRGAKRQGDVVVSI